MIYFIQCGENGLIKIGYSYSPEKRLSELQTGSPIPLKILTTIPGDIDSEFKLHKQFDDFRANGEWFYPVKPVLDFIKLSSNKVFIPSRNKIFALDNSMIAKPQLFDLTLNQLVSTPPQNGRGEYHRIMMEHFTRLYDSGLAKRLINESIHLVKTKEAMVAFMNSDYAKEYTCLNKENEKKVASISPAYKKWRTQIIESAKNQEELDKFCDELLLEFPDLFD